MAYQDNPTKLFSYLETATFPPCAPPHPAPLDSFWTRSFTSPLTKRNSEGAVPETSDIVVIGSGITGICAATRLVEQVADADQLAIVVLEARDFCSGATGRNGGHVTSLPVLQFGAITSLYGGEEAKRAVELEDRAVEFFVETCKQEGWEREVDLVQGGNIHLFDDEASAEAVKSELKAAEKAGIDVSKITWLSKNEVATRVGAEAFAGVAIPSSNLYPLRFVTALFQRALRQISQAGDNPPVSLDVYTHTVVSTIEPSSHSPYRWTVQTSRGPILARSVIHATNGYASSVVPSLASGPSRIVPTRGQVLAYAPQPTSNPRWTTAFSAPHSREYFFQRPNGGPIIIGGARAAAGAPYEFGVSDDSQVNDRVEEELREYLPKQFPRWFADGKEGHVDQSWTGVMGYREGGVPLVGQLYVDGEARVGQFISAGYSGHGVVRAPVCGQAIADMALAELRGESFKMPDWMPEHFLSTAHGSANKAAVPEEHEEKGSKCLVV
ncbi:FAD dependent oxidoreductase-domain-containing protein [Leucosporidium creatinivorum]|uniref:FAD dependent oxidoreductase-domain-containing protein n=1 Tax=Leucosporidium creatinivorum TaxID=106004 RepID=A0A1Y2EQS6_9BASI|nr:FAD dependent oxidoreductase-domain-containing protein [Leucosporidium creatinivorum]